LTSSAAARWLLLAALWSLQHIFARAGAGPRYPTDALKRVYL